jgi:hypothetical protein
MCVYYNTELTAQKLNIEWFIQELLTRQQFFKCEYQLQRLILGCCKLIEKQMLTNSESTLNLIHSLPIWVERLVVEREKEEGNHANGAAHLPKEDIDVEN